MDRTKPADAVVAEKESRQLVQQALEVLDTDKRAVFVLHEIEGFTMPDISEMVGAPVNTCYSRLRLARERFSAEARRLAAGEPAKGAA